MRRIPLFAVLIAGACGGGGGRPTGPPVPILDTIRTYRGNVAYFVTGPRLDQRDANGRLVPQAGFVTPNFPRPAPRFPVEILGPTGALLGGAITDANGDYEVTVNFGKNPAPDVRVRTYARMTLSGGVELRILPFRGADPYEKVSPVTPDAPTVTVDLAIGLAEGAGAFHIADTLFEGLSAVRGGVLGTMPDLDVVWAPGNGAVSRFTAITPVLGELVVAGGIAGDDASNQDTWDEPQLMRLLGEYFLAYFSNSVAPPGTPDDSLLVPSAAWREGFLDFWACAARGTPEFWDTEGTGAAGRLVRFFDAESFFDPALGSLGQNDPNVYQERPAVGIGSRFTVTEVLWDLFDDATDKDNDSFGVPFFLMLRDLETLDPGSSYPYLYTALDRYVANLSLSATQADIILSLPEDQGLDYPARDGALWPTPVLDPLRPDEPIARGLDVTLSDRLDNLTPPVNEEIGLFAQRYFALRTALQFATTATVTSAASLRVEILAFTNDVLASGAPSAKALLPPGNYVIRVLPDAGPVAADFDLRIQLVP